MGVIFALVLVALSFWEGFRTGRRSAARALDFDVAAILVLSDVADGFFWLVERLAWLLKSFWNRLARILRGKKDSERD